MQRRFILALAAMAGTCCVSHAQVIISEVVSGPMSGGNPKFLELFNASTTTTVTLGTGDRIRIYSNGNATANTLYDFGANDGANNVTLLPGQVWTIASSLNGGVAQWSIAYGSAQPNVFTGSAMGNGNDAYALENASGIVDVLGVIGNGPDGAANSSDFSMTWSYSNSWVRRNPNVCAPNATYTVSEWTIPVGDSNGTNSLRQGASDNTGGVWTTNVQNNTNPGTHANVCATGNDCNGNGINDAQDISSGFSQDCNGNSIPDECDISSGASRDCDGNNVPDSCQIAGNPGALDCDSNGVLDSCEISANDCNTNGVLDRCDISAGTSQDVNANGIPDECEPFLFDCNGNQVEDAIDISSGTSSDCNGNSVPDECEFVDGTLTDADGNGIADSCEGAYVAEALVNATVQPSPFGIRNAPNGEAFMNVEGADYGTFASYGGLRFDMAAVKAQFDAAYPGGWTVSKAYLYLMQSNAAFTVDGPVEVVWTDNDSIDFSYDANPEVTFYENYFSDYTDLQQVMTYDFVRGADNPPNNPGGNGTVESHLLFDANGSNTVGGNNVNVEIGSGFGQLTLLLHENASFVTATYAGVSNFSFRGPSLVVFAVPAGSQCASCAADYDQDGGVTGADVEAFFIDFESGAGCADVDLDGGVTGSDVEAFFIVFEAGGC